MEKNKNIIITFSFIIILFGVFFINLIAKDEDISILERRKLAQFPEFTTEKLLSGKWIDEFEDYTQDQFFGRDLFKNINLFGVLTFLDKKIIIKCLKKMELFIKWSIL